MSSELRLEDLRTYDGEPVDDVMARVVRFFDSFRLHPGTPNVRLNLNPGYGTWITCTNDKGSYTPFFFCQLTASGTVTVGPGQCNGIFPFLSGVPLNGIDGKKVYSQIPELKLTGGPNATLESWVALRIVVDLKTGKLALDANKKPQCSVIHTNSMDPSAGDGGYPDDGKGAGLQALAKITWDDIRTPSRIWQITTLNLQHVYRFPITGSKITGRHFFSGL